MEVTLAQKNLISEVCERLGSLAYVDMQPKLFKRVRQTLEEIKKCEIKKSHKGWCV